MKDLKLTPAEMSIVNYHRNTIATGRVGTDPDGRPVTVYATGIKIMDGPYKGKFVSVPGYFDGKVHTSEGEIYRKWKDEINAGKWPMYNSGQELNKRSVEIHQIMDNEERQAIESRNKSMPDRVKKRQLLQDAEEPKWLN